METNIIEVTKISEKNTKLLQSAGFVKQGNNKWIVPSDMNIVTSHPRYDLIDIDVFYGDAKILKIWGKNAFYDYHMSISIDEDNIKKYIEKTISSVKGENFEKSLKESNEASIKEMERQKNLAKTDPRAYESEGLIALMNLIK